MPYSGPISQTQTSQGNIDKVNETQLNPSNQRDVISDNQVSPGTSGVSAKQQSKAVVSKARREQMVDTEKYKIALEKPTPGMIIPSNVRMGNSGLDEDDEFFHLTCHVDHLTRSKIEQGEFVELEKLLPRDKFRKSNDRLELIHRDGATFFAPAGGESKITNVRHWEQAFRIYAAIYSMANPHRSAEIWQYVYVINTAASSYVWDNVANYDFTFRHLMAENPQRSWAKV